MSHFTGDGAAQVRVVERRTMRIGGELAFALTLAFALVFGVLVGTSDARADTPGEPIRLSWVRDESAASCPSAQRIERGVREYLGRDPFASSASTALEISVTRDAGSFVAVVHVRGADGALRGSRTLRSEESCETLASAVSLAVALFVDPDAALRPHPPLAAPAAPLPPSKPRASSTSEAGMASVPRDLHAPRAELESSSSRSAIRSGSASLGAFGSIGLEPGAAVGVRIRADVEFSHHVHGVLSGAFVPEKKTSDARFAFGLTNVGLGACVDVVSTARFQIGPCAHLEAGEIHAVVFTLAPLPPGGRFWSAAEVAARARIRLFSAVFVEADAGAVVPFVRYRFAVTGESNPVFQESVVVPAADLSAGLTFP
jgi:hypothetical protein